MESKPKLMNDKYRKARDGHFRFLNIYCARCNQHIMLYQKDVLRPLCL